MKLSNLINNLKSYQDKLKIDPKVDIAGLPVKIIVDQDFNISLRGGYEPQVIKESVFAPLKVTYSNFDQQSGCCDLVCGSYENFSDGVVTITESGEYDCALNYVLLNKYHKDLVGYISVLLNDSTIRYKTNYINQHNYVNDSILLSRNYFKKGDRISIKVYDVDQIKTNYQFSLWKSGV